MSLVLEFLPEAAAEVECITGDYEARAAAWATFENHCATANDC